MAMLADSIDGVIGVDTHRDTLTAAAVTAIGGLLAHATATTDHVGYQQLLEFASGQVPARRCWAIEGAGSFGAGLAVFLAGHGEQVVEVPRRRRSARRYAAKSDALDAVHIARDALVQTHPVLVRRGGDREALRVLLTTRRNAVNARIQAVNQLKALIVSAPEELGPSCAAVAPGSDQLLRRPSPTPDQIPGASDDRPGVAGDRPAPAAAAGRDR